MKVNLKTFPGPYRWKYMDDFWYWKRAFEAELREIDAESWFEANVFEGWTWEGMLDKFIRKEILGE